MSFSDGATWVATWVVRCALRRSCRCRLCWARPHLPSSLRSQKQQQQQEQEKEEEQEEEQQPTSRHKIKARDKVLLSKADPKSQGRTAH